MSNTPPNTPQQTPYNPNNNNRRLPSAWQPTAPTSSLQATTTGNPYYAYGPPAGAPYNNPYYAQQRGYYQPQQQYYQPPPQQPTAPAYQPPARERRSLTITDKFGNPIDLGASASGKTTSAPAANTASAAAPSSSKPGESAGNKMRELALARLQEDAKKENAEANAKEADPHKKSAEEAAKKAEEEEAERTRKEEEAERTRKEEEAERTRKEEEETLRKKAEEEEVLKRMKAEEEQNARKKAEEESARKRREEEAAAAAAAVATAAARIKAEEEGRHRAEEERAAARKNKRHVYTKDDLLRFRELDICCCRPDDLPDMTVERGPSRGGSQGSNRGGGGGSGTAVGSFGGGNQSWSRGMQAPPVRRQSSSGQKPPQQQEGGPQWARGQGLPPPVKKAGRGNSRGSFSEPPMDFKPLVKSENHWRPKKNSSALVVAEKKVKSILNKMTKEKFETLSQQMCEIPLESYETLSMMIRFVYEKAIDEPSFGDMYADLCALLSRTAQTSSFVHFIQSDEEKDNGSPQVWRWSNDVSHDDGEIVGPFEDEDDAFDAALADETMAPIERGEMTLELVRLRIANDTFIKILKNTENDDHYVVFFPMKEAEECGQQMSEFFLTERECRSDASKHNSFKRSLLNKCQDEFNKQDIYEDWKKEKASYLETKDSLTEAEQTEKEGELNFRRIKIKKQMLGNIKFIGQLYKKNLLKEKIMRYCIATLLKLDEDKSISGKNTEYIDSGQTDLDEEDHEALCSMFSTIGKTIDTPEAADFMDVCFTKIERFSDDKAQNSRSRFMYKDLIELRKNSWEPRRKQEKAKTLEEIRKDVEREELLHAQESQKFAPGRGGGRGGRGSNIGGRGFMRGGGDRRQTDHMVQPGRGRSSFKSQDDDSFAGRGGSFRFSSSGGRGDRRGSASSPTRTSARQVSPTPGQGGHGSSTSLRSAAARSVSPSPPGPSSFAPPPMSGEKLERRIDGMRTEYMQDPGNVPELLLSMDGISGTPGAGFIFVQRNADRVMDCKDEERKAIIDMIKILFQKEKLSKEDIENGMGEIVEFVDSFVIDSPRAYEYIGDVVSELLHVGAVDVQWLAMQTEKTKLSPESAVPERVVKDVMAAFVNKFGKEKAHTVFDDGVEKLAEVLGIDKWNTIAGSVMG